MLGVHKNKTLLIDRRPKVLEIRFPSAERVITTIKELNSRKASNTWQEEKFWIAITIADLSTADIHMYLGCSKFGRRSNEAENTTYTCPPYCAVDTSSIPRMTLKIQATDDTSTMELTLFSKEIETLFGRHAPSIGLSDKN